MTPLRANVEDLVASGVAVTGHGESLASAHAADDGRIAADAANGLATLPAFASWGGVAAQAATEAIGTTRRDLDAHGREAQAVANAARSAADEIERIKSELATVKADAESLGMEIDPVTGRVLPGRSIRDPARTTTMYSSPANRARRCVSGVRRPRCSPATPAAACRPRTSNDPEPG